MAQRDDFLIDHPANSSLPETAHPPALFLGVDTGGTFTDGVLLDPHTRQVVRSTKVLTTHHDLTICVSQVLDRLAPPDPAAIALVSLSTTLATNAIVEGKRSPVALLLLGYDPELVHQYNFQRQFGTADYFFIRGKHNLDGVEIAPLDEAEIERVVAQVLGRVSAFAVASYAGPRNSGHEQRAAEIISGLSHLPVIQAHHLSSELDSIRRATTASLNASLLSQTQDFLEAVEAQLSQKGIHCPVMILRGDGSIVKAAYARRRPVEIIHSGPATSAIGGQFLSGAETALVVDVGGTTTDLCMVDRGQIESVQNGATVGPYRTCIRTIKARSFGLGGDSLIRFDHYQNLEIGPERVLPLAHLAYEYPQVKQELLSWLKWKGKFNYSDDLEYWVFRREPRFPLRNAFAEKALELLRLGPKRKRDLVKAVKAVSALSLDVETLLNQGIIERSGLTPTDILHTTGEFCPWDQETALRATEAAAKMWSEDAPAFARRVKSWITRKMAAEIIQYLSGKGLSEQAYTRRNSRLDRWLYEESLNARNPYLGSKIFLKVPLVGIGAPAAVFLPEVARALGAELVLPPHFEVANAVGTVVGNVMARQEGSVFPCLDGSLITGSLARVANGAQKFESYEQALAFVRATLVAQVTEQAQAAGAEAVVVECEENVLAPGMVDLSAWAVGKPGANGNSVG